MKYGKLFSILAIACLLSFTGCQTESAPSSKQEKPSLTSSPSTTNDTSAQPKTTEASLPETGQGFQPPEGSHRDKNGHIVDPEGNTFEEDGSWAVPEGGHVDSKGRIYDKDGNLMGGGAPIGSKG